MKEGRLEIKMAASLGLYHMSSTVKFVGNDRHSKR
jgi:hypothetical protein